MTFRCVVASLRDTSFDFRFSVVERVGRRREGNGWLTFWAFVNTVAAGADVIFSCLRQIPKKAANRPPFLFTTKLQRLFLQQLPRKTMRFRVCQRNHLFL